MDSSPQAPLSMEFSRNSGVGCHALLQGIFPTQGWNPGLQHCRWILYHLSHQRSPFFVWEDSRVWAHWNHPFDMHHNNLSCFSPSWIPSGCTVSGSCSDWGLQCCLSSLSVVETAFRVILGMLQPFCLFPWCHNSPSLSTQGQENSSAVYGQELMIEVWCLLKNEEGDFPGGAVAKTPCSQCRRPGFNP